MVKFKMKQKNILYAFDLTIGAEVNFILSSKNQNRSIYSYTKPYRMLLCLSCYVDVLCMTFECV